MVLITRGPYQHLHRTSMNTGTWHHLCDGLYAYVCNKSWHVSNNITYC